MITVQWYSTSDSQEVAHIPGKLERDLATGIAQVEGQVKLVPGEGIWIALGQKTWMLAPWHKVISVTVIPDPGEWAQEARQEAP